MAAYYSSIKNYFKDNEPKEIEYDSMGNKMKLLKHRHLEEVIYGIPNGFWTKYT